MPVFNNMSSQAWKTLGCGTSPDSASLSGLQGFDPSEACGLDVSTSVATYAHTFDSLGFGGTGGGTGDDLMSPPTAPSHHNLFVDSLTSATSSGAQHGFPSSSVGNNNCKTSLSLLGGISYSGESSSLMPPLYGNCYSPWSGMGNELPNLASLTDGGRNLMSTFDSAAMASDIACFSNYIPASYYQPQGNTQVPQAQTLSSTAGPSTMVTSYAFPNLHHQNHLDPLGSPPTPSLNAAAAAAAVSSNVFLNSPADFSFYTSASNSALQLPSTSSNNVASYSPYLGATGGTAQDCTPAEGGNLRELEAFAEMFKQRRIKLGVTQADVGRALGNLKISGVGPLSQSTICRFESLTLSHNNMIALMPVLKAWLEEAEAKAAKEAELRERGLLDDKRKRTSITDAEKRSLEVYFTIQPRPSSEKISQIADKLNLKKNVVRVWFCNQRQKQKRMKFTSFTFLGSGDQGLV